MLTGDVFLSVISIRNLMSDLSCPQCFLAAPMTMQLFKPKVDEFCFDGTSHQRRLMVGQSVVNAGSSFCQDVGVLVNNSPQVVLV